MHGVDEEHLKEVKEKAVYDFENHCNHGLFMIELDLQHNVCEELNKFGNIEYPRCIRI